MDVRHHERRGVKMVPFLAIFSFCEEGSTSWRVLLEGIAKR